MNLQVQTASYCNGSCLFCPYPESWQKTHSGVMSHGVFQKILSSLPAWDKICLYFQNEPFLDPWFLDRVKYVVDNCEYKKIEIATNAPFFYEKDLYDILKGTNHIVKISFHGVDKKSYRLNMGLNFDSHLKNAVKLIESGLNCEIWSAYGPRVKSLALPCNYDPNASKAFWAKYNVQVHNFTYHDRAGSIHRNKLNLGMDRTPPKCARYKDWLHFLWNGDSVLCCMDYHRETYLGDISDINEVINNRAPMNICRRCISPNG